MSLFRKDELKKVLKRFLSDFLEPEYPPGKCRRSSGDPCQVHFSRAVALKPGGMFEFLEKMHDFYCRVYEAWGQTNVDALFFMDDWGGQQSLLISPQLWCEVFKPLYKGLYRNFTQAWEKGIYAFGWIHCGYNPALFMRLQEFWNGTVCTTLSAPTL